MMCCLILCMFPLSPSDLGCWRGHRPGGLGVLRPQGPSYCQASSRAVWEHKALQPRPPWAHLCSTSRWPFSRSLRWKTRTRALNGRFGYSRAWSAAGCSGGTPVPPAPPACFPLETTSTVVEREKPERFILISGVSCHLVLPLSAHMSPPLSMHTEQGLLVLGRLASALGLLCWVHWKVLAS